MIMKAGETFRAVVPFSQPKSIKVHVTHVIPSSCYSDRTLVIYKLYGNHKQWWHEFMCTERDMDYWKGLAI